MWFCPDVFVMITSKNLPGIKSDKVIDKSATQFALIKLDPVKDKVNAV